MADSCGFKGGPIHLTISTARILISEAAARQSAFLRTRLDTKVGNSSAYGVDIAPEATRDALTLARLVDYCEHKAAENKNLDAAVDQSKTEEAAAHAAVAAAKMASAAAECEAARLAEVAAQAARAAAAATETAAEAARLVRTAETDAQRAADGVLAAQRLLADGDPTAPWKQALMLMGPAELLRLVQAANYLDVEGLLDLACTAAANICKGMPAERIAALFGIDSGRKRRREEEDGNAAVAATAADMSVEWNPRQPYTDPTMQAGLIEAAEAADEVEDEAGGGLRVVAEHTMHMEAKRCAAANAEFDRRERAAAGLAVSVTEENVVIVWRIVDGVVLRQVNCYPTHPPAVLSIADIGGGRVAISAERGGLLVLDVETGASLAHHILDRAEDDFACIVGLPPRSGAGAIQDGGRVAASTFLGSGILLLQAEVSHKQVGRLDGHEGYITTLSGVHRRGDSQWLLASGGSDETIRLWDVDTGECAAVLQVPDCGELAALVDLGGGRLLSGSTDGSWRVWDVDAAACLTVQEDPLFPDTLDVFMDICALPGGRAAAMGSDGRIRAWVWDEAERTLRAEEDGVPMVARIDGSTGVNDDGECDNNYFAASGSRLIAVDGSDARVWDCGGDDDDRRGGSGSWCQIAAFAGRGGSRLFQTMRT